MRLYPTTSLLLFFLLTTYSILGQNIKFANVIGKQKNEYGIKGNSVFKLDSLGNSIWVKDFSGQIVSSTYSNELIGSAFDGTSLYVLELQGGDFSSLPHNCNGALIKMDTSGNVQFVISSSVFPGGGYSLVDVYPSISKGVWIVDDYSPGHTHLIDVLKIDSSGTAGNFVNFWYGSVTRFKGLHLLPDSNYIFCGNEEGIFGTDLFPALTKFTKDGTVLWRKNYNTNLTTGIEILLASTTTVDSSGNIYMICSESSVSFSGAVGIKVKSNGTTLISKYWADMAAYDIKSLRYQNGQIIGLMNGSEIYFDTLLNISCFQSQNISLIESNNYLFNGHVPGYSPVNFTPVDDTIFSYVAQTFPDYCSVLSTKELPEKNNHIELYPNPFQNKITINNIKSNHLEIIDITGRIVYSESTADESIKEIFPDLPSGIYYLRIQNDIKSESFRIICIR